MPAMATRRCSSLLFLSAITLFTAVRISRQTSTKAVCDDGQYMIHKDLGGEENWKCLANEEYGVSRFLEPAGQSQCEETSRTYTYKCMKEELSYDSHPPTVGDCRPLAPRYGEYKYLPPQRWIHALKRGGLAFLYHPCTSTEQVLQLKELARSCLWRHVITPYPLLTEDLPLAIVSWGCVYRMTWVNSAEARQWIIEHALKAEGSTENANGHYKEGLLHNATLIDDHLICDESHDLVPDQPDHNNGDGGGHQPPASGRPSAHTASSDHEPFTPCQQSSGDPSGEEEDSSTKDTPCSQSTDEPPKLTVHVSHGSTLTILIVLLSLVLFVAVMIVLWRLCSIVRDRCCERKKQAKYKSVSKFFPFSYGQEASNGVAIPEYGLPKGRAAEREILLNDSDEDEL